MHLVLRQVEVPDVLVSGDQHFHDAVIGSAVLLGDERPQEARPSAGTGRGELETDRQPIAGRIGAAIQAHPQLERKGSILHD